MLTLLFWDAAHATQMDYTGYLASTGKSILLEQKEKGLRARPVQL